MNKYKSLGIESKLYWRRKTP